MPKTKIETDSYIAVQLLKYKKVLNAESIKFMAEKVQGSFAFSVLDSDNSLWFIKGDSPLSLLHFPKMKIYVYASTDEILYKSLIDYSPIFSSLKNGEYEAIDIYPGDILKIRTDGIIERSKFNYNYYYSKRWWNYEPYSYISLGNVENGNTKNDYINDLKSVASYMGYTPDVVDELINAGFTFDEIEDYMYYGGEI